MRRRRRRRARPPELPGSRQPTKVEVARCENDFSALVDQLPSDIANSGRISLTIELNDLQLTPEDAAGFIDLLDGELGPSSGRDIVASHPVGQVDWRSDNDRSLVLAQ